MTDSRPVNASRRPLSMLALALEIVCLIFQVIKGFYTSIFELIFPRQPKSLKGEVALITGAGGGLGRELALQMAALGVRIIAVDINNETVETTVKIIQERAYGEDSLAFTCDLTNPKEVADLVRKIKQITKVTMLVNNAGIAFTKSLMKHRLAEIESTFQVNVFAQFYLLQQFLPEFLEEDKGHIVTIGSIASSVGTANLVAYCSSKYAIRGLTESLFAELRQNFPNTSVKMTTAHPYTFSSNLVPSPKNRFNTLMPILTPKCVAQRVIEAVRKDEETVMMPRLASFLSTMQHVFPRPVVLAVIDFMECGVHEVIE